MSEIKRLALLTGGGDCPGLNAAIRAVVKSACLEHKLEVIGIRDGFRGLVENDFLRLDFDDVSGILPRGGTILGTSNRHNPFHFPITEKNQNNGYGDLSKQAVANIRENGWDVLIVIGGDGTQSIAARLYNDHDIPVVGIPKTIDNDLNGTDVTIGFNTALHVATEAVDRIHSTAESHHRVMVVEVMGRYAGWIALEAGLAGGGDVILIPEIPFKMDEIAARIIERTERGKRFSLVVVAEGSTPEGGEMVVKRRVEEASDPIRLGGVSRELGEELENITGMETRYTILGHVQRGGNPTAFDRILATRLGYEAVKAAVNGRFGELVGLRGSRIAHTPIREAMDKTRRVTPDHPLVRTARAIGTSFGA